MLLYGCIDIISWIYWMYSIMDLPLVDVVSVLVSLACIEGYRVVWLVVSLCWLEHIVSWVHWPSAHRSISYAVVAFACRMTPNSSLSLLHVFSNCIVYSKFPYSCIFLRTCNAYAEIGLFVLIYLICSRCLISIDLQSGQHMICYMFWTVIYIFYYSLFCFVVSYCIIGFM